jgi:hypothetical protein
MYIDSCELGAEQHVDILVSGLKSILQVKMTSESRHGMNKKMFLMVRKLSNFLSIGHSDRELAVYTSSKLLEVACSNDESAQGNKQVMEVAPYTSFALVA